jgi:hypothetical protein
MYYSFNTIDSKYNNTQFAIIHGSTEETIDIQPGLYTIDSLNAYLQFKLDSLGWYSTITNLQTQTETRIYYLKFEANVTYNRVTLTADVVPSTLPTDTDTFAYAKGPGLSLTGKTMQLKILDNNFKDVLGFNVGSYPPTEQSTAYTGNGQNLPHPSRVEQIFVTCNLVFEMNSNFIPAAIANFDLNAEPRGQMQYYRDSPTAYGIQAGKRYDSIIISLLDQDGNSISYDQGESILIELQLQSRF